MEYVPEPGFVQLTLAGRVTEDGFKEATIEGVGAAKEHNTNRVLIDDSHWAGGASATRFKSPAVYVEHGVDPGSKAAIVSPPSGTAEIEDVQFYRTVCKNRGWNSEVLREREEAIDWLVNE